MRIVLDSYKLSEMALISSSISNLLDESAMVLSGLVEHSNWNCREKHRINTDIMAVKKKSEDIKSDILNLESVLNQIVLCMNNLYVAEQTSSSKIDSLIGSIYSIDCDSISIRGSGQSFSSAIRNINSNSLNQIERFAVENTGEPLQIIDFNSVFIGKNS